MKKEGPKSYASAKWLRSEARETHKDNVFFCVFLCILWALKTNRRIVMGKIFKFFILQASMLLCLPVFGQVDALMLRYPDVSETQITFVYAGDIWVAPKIGGLAHRLSSPKGEEMFPRFSPDGTQIAFSGNYDGNIDVYVLSTRGGMLQRVTHHPEPDRLVDWYPDGKSLLYASRMASARRVFNQFYKTSPKGGMPEKLPLPYGEFGAVSPDEKYLAFTFISQEFRTWKRYRGGMAPDTWLFDLEKKTAINITHHDANDALPMWHGSTLYFLSDRGPNQRANIWAYEMKSTNFRQVTSFDTFDVRFPAIGPSDIIFENGGQLYLLGLSEEKIRKVKIKVVTDRASIKTRVEKAAHLIRTTGISPTGKRALFEARGDIFTVPAEHGAIRNLTRTSGVAERYPGWSPDGQWIAYFSDRPGEYELTIRAANGSGNETTLTSLGKGFRYRPHWSPDSKKLVFIDKTSFIRLFNRDTNKLITIDKTMWMLHYGMERFHVNWSPDSRWIAYSRGLENLHNAVFLFDTKTSQRFQVTSGFYSEFGPVFDPDGKYLYFFSSRNLSPIYSDLQPTWIYVNSTHIAAVVLQKDLPSPLAPRNDREGMKGSDGKAKSEKEDEKKEEPKPVKIDPDGLENRLVILPPAAGNYRNLTAISGKVIYHRRPRTGASDRKSPVMYYDLKEREEKTIFPDADEYTLSANGKKMLVRKEPDFAIIDVKPNQEMKKKLAVSDMEKTIDPKAEWQQVFTDTWRFERDFFYDPGTHGIDWEKLRKRYGKLLEYAVTRWDVNFVIGELIGELSAGHIFRFGGQTEKTARRGVGLLGVDFALTNGAFQIKKIISVSPQNTDVRSPLREPGVNVKEGDYLLAVNGADIDTSKDPWAAFQGLADRTVILTVNNKPSSQGAWDVVVKTLSNERLLRERAWVEANRQKVEKATNGRIGYIYVRNTARSGQTEFLRQFLAQFPKQGLIIDERFNSGGQLADRFIEILKRPVYNYIYFRDSKDWRMPLITNIGPKVMLMNGWSGSGGDAFPFYFRQAGIGPLIGTRTWGGLVGPAYVLPLIDGGGVSAPPGRFYSSEGKWIIENIGVKPDIHLVNNPGLMAVGRDPQLERAIDEVLKMLEKNPPLWPKRPPFPGRSKR
jgi:tricorn protease